MKGIFKKLSESEKPKGSSLTITNTNLEPATSTAISTADPMSFVPATAVTASPQVIQAAGVTVSIHLRPSH
jgi:hypothetical protein